MNFTKNMTIRLLGMIFAVVATLAGCGGGGSGTSTPPPALNPADVAGSWKVVSFTPAGGASGDLSSYNISLVITASAYTMVFPVSIPAGQSACTEYGTWSISGNNLTTTPIAGSTCGNTASTSTVSISGTTMTQSDAHGTAVFQKQTATPVTASALVGTWKIIAAVNKSTGAVTQASSIVILDPSTYSLSHPNCAETGTWSVTGSSVSFTPATGTCGASGTYNEPASWNDPLMLWTETQDVGVLARLLDAPASPVATGTGSGVSLSWQAVSGAGVYYVYRGTTPGALAAKTQIATAVTSSYLDTTAVSGTTYYYQVTAVDVTGVTTAESRESMPSTEVSGAAAAPPGPVTGLNATAGVNQATVDWNAVTGATSYNIYWYSTGIGMCQVFARDLYTNDYPLTGWTLAGPTALTTYQPSLPAGICYQFMVTAVNAYGESLSTSYVNVTLQ